MLSLSLNKLGIKSVFYNNNRMDLLHKQRITPRQIAQLYRSTQLDYLTDGVPSEYTFSNSDLYTYQDFTMVGQLWSIKLEAYDQKQFFCVTLLSAHSKYERHRKIYVPIMFYKQYFIKFMNQAIKRKAQFQMMITELEPFILNNQIVFGVTQKSALIVISGKFFEKELDPVINSFKNRFSYIKLENIFNACEVEFYKNNGVPLEDLRNKFAALTQSPSNLCTITGAVDVKYISIQNEGRKKCKVIVFNLYQTQVRHDTRELGVYNVRGFFYFEQESDLTDKLASWSTVMIKNTQRHMDDSGKLEYRFHSQQDITVLDQVDWRYAHNLQKIWKRMVPIEFSDLKTSVIFRNYVKVRVELIRVVFIKMFFQCRKCKVSMKSKICESCNVEPEFHLWSECEVDDGSDIGYISIQKNHLIKFFGFSKQQKQELEELCLRFNRSLLINRNTQSEDKTILKLQYLMSVKRIHKHVVGVPMIELRKQVGGDGLKEDTGLGMGTEKFRSLNVNGVLERKDGVNRWLVKLKVHEVI